MQHNHFSLCYNKIPTKATLGRKEVYFGSRSKGTQSIVVGKQDGKGLRQQLITMHPQSGTEGR